MIVVMAFGSYQVRVNWRFLRSLHSPMFGWSAHSNTAALCHRHFLELSKNLQNKFPKIPSELIWGWPPSGQGLTRILCKIQQAALFVSGGTKEGGAFLVDYKCYYCFSAPSW